MNDDALAIGIDFGTTKVSAAIFRNNKVDVIKDECGNLTMPALVAFTDKRILVGDEVKELDSNQIDIIFDIKRLMGRDLNDPVVKTYRQHWPFTMLDLSKRPKIVANYKGRSERFSTEEITSMILSRMKERAEKYLGQSVRDAVISVPANFNDSQRQAIIDAGSIAGFNVLGVINEPTATAIAYDFHEKPTDKRNILIFDFGAGKCDISVATVYRGIVQMTFTIGKTLGGRDFDGNLIEILIKTFENEHNLSLRSSKRAIQRLRSACEESKRKLSFSAEHQIKIDRLMNDINFTSSMNRQAFLKFNNGLFLQTIGLIRQMMTESGIHPSNIDEVVLVGGSSRMPMLQNLLAAMFNPNVLNKSLLDIETVAFGAAVKAAIIRNDKSDAIRCRDLIDISSHSIVLETNRKSTVLFNRNTIIPAKITGAYMFPSWITSIMSMRIFENDPIIPMLSHFSGEFQFIHDPRRFLPQIIVTFQIDTNGILKITAAQQSINKNSTGHCGAMKNIFRFSDDEIKMMATKVKEIRFQNVNEKKKLAAANLKSICEKIASTLSNAGLKLKMSRSDRFTIAKRCNEILDWLNKNQLANINEFELRHQLLKTLSIPILKTLYEQPETNGIFTHSILNKN